jgi:hypothetical protein
MLLIISSPASGLILSSLISSSMLLPLLNLEALESNRLKPYISVGVV